MENLAINDFFENLLRISPDFITMGVVIICAALFVISLFFKWRDISPALMISAGIIGTFWGTFIALADFETGADHEAMVESIPAVLGGMKTAFITSLIGLFSAFFSKIVFHALPKPKSEPLPIESDTLELLQEIKNSIAGEKDGNLSSQLTELKKGNVAGFKKIDEQLDKHMGGLAEAIRTSLVENMDALMEKIQDVIADKLVGQLQETNELLRDQLREMLDSIEKTLIKQFGETFREFNEATKAIKKWQEEHKGHVEQITEAFDMTAKGIEKIRSDCESIPLTMGQLKEVMGELDERLKAFADMKDKAVDSFSTIHKNLDGIIANLQNSVKGFENIEIQMNQTAEQIKESGQSMIKQSRDASTQHQETISEIINRVQEASEQCVEDTKARLTEMAEHHASAINDSMTKIAKSWGDNMLGIAEEVAKRIEKSKR